MKKQIVFLLALFSVFALAQEKKLDTNTESVKEHRAMGYPIRVLDQLPVIKGCEPLKDNKAYAAKCMKDQLNFLFAPFMKDIGKLAKDSGASVYVEFVITKDGSISDIKRLKVSEPQLDEYTRKQYILFRRKLFQEKIIISPGRVHDRYVDTLYGVRFFKVFENRR